MRQDTIIYGASDDLIEIMGEVRDEANAYDAKDVSIKCSDGTEANITYNGEWKITLTKEGTSFNKLVGSVGDDEKHTDEDCMYYGVSSYSDALHLKAGIEWVKIGRKKFSKP